MRFTLLTAVICAASFSYGADPSLLNLVMPDAQVVAGVNVAKARTSPFGQFIIRQMPEGGDFAKFVNASGFDPRRDLQEVLMASTAGKNNGLVAARGSFDAAKIIALATADGKHKTESYNGAQLVLATSGTDEHAVAFFDTSFAVAGEVDQVKAAVDRRKNQNPINPLLAAKVAAYSAADAWTVSLVPLSGLAAGAKTGKVPGPFEGVLQGDLLKKVTEESGSVTFNSPVLVTGELVADTDEDATALGNVVKFLASMIQTSNVKAGEQVATLIQSLNVSTQGNILKLGLAIPEADLEALIQNAEKGSAREKGPERI